MSSTDLFARISIIAVGDLYQLPPIWKRSVFDDFKIEALNLCHPRHVFRMVKLSEIMRQKNDKAFTELFNRIRTASHTEDDVNILQSRCTNLMHFIFGLKMLP
jgi:hypothetical protein